VCVQEEDIYHEIEYRTPVPFEEEWSGTKVRIALRKYIILLARRLAEANGWHGGAEGAPANRAEHIVAELVDRSYAPLFGGKADGETELEGCDPTTDLALDKSERKRLAAWAKSKALREKLDKGAQRVIGLLREIDSDPAVHELLLLRYVEMITNHFLSTERVYRFLRSCFSPMK
jgi:hypothetical protein